MSKYRRAAKIDNNQHGIVDSLRAIPGVTVATGHDDILVGYKGRTYWFEIKQEDVISPVTGEPVPSSIKKSQKDLLDDWRGHYMIVWRVDQILTELGISSGENNNDNF